MAPGMRKLLTFLLFLLAALFAVFFLVLTAMGTIDCVQHHRFDSNDALYLIAVLIGAALTSKGAAEMWLRLGRA